VNIDYAGQRDSEHRFVRTKETTRFQIAVLAVWLISSVVSIAVVTCLDTRDLDIVWRLHSVQIISIIMTIPVALVVKAWDMEQVMPW